MQTITTIGRHLSEAALPYQLLIGICRCPSLLKTAGKMSLGIASR
jgi:hypothetical protein